MAVVLVPGFMLTRDLWRDIVPALDRFGPVLHADTRTGSSIAEMARLALETAPGEFILIGFSMGGYIAREIERLAPERVSRLVLIATSARGDSEIQAQRQSAAADATPGTFRGISRKAIRRSLAPGRENDTGLIERIHAMSVEAGGGVFQRQASLRREGDLDRLAEIRCPTLVIAGSHDRLRRLEEAQELHDGIRGSKFVVLDAGHMIPMEAPSELVRVLQSFLTEQDTA